MWYPVCPINRYDRLGLIDRMWVKNYCKGNWKKCIRYKMESQGLYHPDNMMPDGRIDENLS